MATPKRKKAQRQRDAYKTLTAIGIGLGIGSISVELAEIHDRQWIAVGGIVLGVGLTASLLPWDRWIGD